jgi:hypothetical protein
MLTGKEWADVTEHLNQRYCLVAFNLGDDLIEVMRVNRKDSYYPLIVYINKEANPDWVNGGHKAPGWISLVWRQKTSAKFSAKAIKDFEKEVGKRQAKKAQPDLHDKVTYYTPEFSSVGVFVKQFKQIEGLTLKAIGKDCVDSVTTKSEV